MAVRQIIFLSYPHDIPNIFVYLQTKTVVAHKKAQ